MRKIMKASMPFITEIKDDLMMWACLLAPLLIGSVFRFGIPVLEEALCREFAQGAMIAPYYAIFDLVFSIMTPVMFCFAGAMVMLEEIDTGVMKAFFASPIGSGGYLFSRMIGPAILAFVYAFVMLLVFSLTKTSFIFGMAYALGGTCTALISTLLVVAFAKNKMEGMALIKLCGILMLGVPAAYLLPEKTQMFAYILPSYWLTLAAKEHELLHVCVCVLLSGLYILILWRCFRKRICK